jgi:hypothetical protein
MGITQTKQSQYLEFQNAINKFTEPPYKRLQNNKILKYKDYYMKITNID